MKDQAAEEKRSADSIQECHKFIEAERWCEAAECFQNILRRNSSDAEARRGFRRARCGEEAAFYVQLAKVSLSQNQLDDAFELLTAVIECEKEYNITLTGSQEMLKEVRHLRELTAKKEELRMAKCEKNWPRAVHLLKEIIKLDPKDEKAKAQLAEATQERDLQALYQQLLRYIGEENWIAAEEKIRQIEQTRLKYEDVSMLKLKVDSNKRWEAWYSDLRRYMKARRWDDAIETCRRIIYEAGDYRDVYKLLRSAQRARKRKPLLKGLKDFINVSYQSISRDTNIKAGWEWACSLVRRIDFRVVGAAVVAALGIVFGVIQILPIISVWFALPDIDRFQIFMDSCEIANVSIKDEPINLAQLLPLIGGEPVRLEVVVVDVDMESKKTYRGYDIKCRWIVTPIDNEIEDIKTEACEALYTPSQNHSKQKVIVEVEGAEQQFKPVPRISMEFEIINN